jgi:hypothetical protein
LRIGVVGGIAEAVIGRNTPVPIEQTRRFTTTQDGQEKVRIRVYQGESREASENELLGEFEFGGFRKAPRGEVWIDVTFEINADGIVNVTARDRETGTQASTRITLSSGLSEREIESIMDEGRTERVRTEAIPAAGREVLGSVKLVPTPVRSVPESREWSPRPAAAAPALQAEAIERFDDAPELDFDGEDDQPLLDAAPEGGAEEFLDIGLGGDAVAEPSHAPASDEDLLDASLDAADSLFDDGDDAPELTEVEASPLDGTSPDTSLFENAGTDLSVSSRGSPKKD